ncbi:TPA: calcium-binding protein [Yersinia enterocolitica]|nr:calcium-binding protein [Yersinia enterocolitica]HDL7833956.1 calcium-binding protein [Yersinia enterocolitica]HDL7874391.1 calcium-binding protein [Yersinia enterocolitica]HDL7886949.1 calcium-binding protein [Yersinia enterocolitica]HDL7893802.1 calcium-binding protein [Yersinia enterocolitica]
MKVQKPRKKKNKNLILEVYNKESKSILILNTSPERVFFQRKGSKLKVVILNDKNAIITIKYCPIIKNDELIIKSIIFHDNNKLKHELFLTLKEEKVKENVYAGRSKDLLLTRKDLQYTSAYHLIQNTTPSEEFSLNENDNFTGHKYIKNKVIGGTGNNIIIGGDKNDNLAGGAGDDVIIGHQSFDALFGQAGDDILIGGKGDDGLAGGAGNDILDGGEGDDELHGDADGFGPYASSEYIPLAIRGHQRGNDIIFGGAGNDRIEGQKNNDYLAGGTGDDLYVFSEFDGINMIVEYSCEENTISIDDYFFHQLRFERYGNHLMISRTENHANNLVIVVKDQFSKNGYKVKHLQTKSYLRHGSEADKKCHEIVVNDLVRKYADTPSDLLKQLNDIQDFGDAYRTDLSELFYDKMPDIEKKTGIKLNDELIRRNNALRKMYRENPHYFGDNLPDINYLLQTLSSFAPKEATQTNFNYLKPETPMDNIANRFFTANN